jgi:hypothetical protein
LRSGYEAAAAFAQALGRYEPKSLAMSAQVRDRLRSDPG